jgi:hypothetical protein
MLTNYQPQILQNPLLLPQTSQSFSLSTISPLNTTLSNDSTKQLQPTSSSTITETIENSHMAISPSHTNETSIPSDTTTTQQPPVNK